MGCLFVVLLPFLPRLLVRQIYCEFPSQSGGGGSRDKGYWGTLRDPKALSSSSQVIGFCSVCLVCSVSLVCSVCSAFEEGRS